MKAFISYSINDTEHFVLTLLSENLRKSGFSIASSYGKSTKHFYTVDALSAKKIREAGLFVGIITAYGANNAKVVAEYHYAQSSKTPALLLLEEGVYLSPDFVNSNVIFFNRQSPQKAISAIKTQIKTSNKSKQKGTDAIAWMFGGGTLSGLVSLLANH